MSLADRLVGRIRRDGPIPFSTFMEAALYDPEHGYYASGAVRTGWDGDYVTSPQLDPAFGALWARAVEDIWDAMGRPRQLHLIEIGPGEGAFAASLLDALSSRLTDVVSYRLVERVPGVRERQRALLKGRVTWSSSLEEVPEVEEGIVLANEVLDNLPVDLYEIRSGTVHEVRVDEHEGTLVEVIGDRVAASSGLALERLEDGHRFETRPGAASLVHAAANIVGRGALVFIDYGYTREEIPLRPGGTLMCYSRGGPDDLVLGRPGTKDITAHVDWTALTLHLEREALQVQGPYPQSAWLRALDAADLDASLQRQHDRALTDKRGADAVALLSRRQALRALLDPGGLGRLEVVVGLKNIPEPAFLKGL